MTTARATSRHRLETYSGLFIDYDDPQPHQIAIEDIAHALANTCRYGGHVKQYYSVAEHAILVSSLLLERGCDFRAAYGGLHHDDHEAYVGDLPTPLKNAMGDSYRDLVERIDGAITPTLGIDSADLHARVVQWADALALRMEAHMLKHSRGEHPEWAPAWERFGLDAPPIQQIGAWTPGLSPRAAEQAFLDAHGKLREAAGV